MMSGQPGASSILAGAACLILGAFVFLLPLPLAFTVPFAGVALVGGVAGIWRGWQRRQSARYDLRGLLNAPYGEPEEPDMDVIPEGELAVPYCGWCDETYPPGTHRCPTCRREL